MSDGDRGGSPPIDGDRSTADVRRLRHDCRAALNHVIGYSEVVLEEAAETGAEAIVVDVRKIHAAGIRLLALLDELGEVAMTGRRSTEVDHGPSPMPSLAETPTEGAAIAPPTPSRPGKLLVVDDNEMNRDVLVRRLSRRGYAVETASGGEEALAVLARRQFDLVLLDVMMPEVDGFEVLRRIRLNREAAALSVVMATARTDSKDVVRALELGANDYVTKPIDFPVVLARVEAQLTLKRARDEVQRLNRNLQLAQDKIAQLSRSVSAAYHEVQAWAVTTAQDVAAVIGVPAVAVWIVEGEALRELTNEGMDLPGPSDLQAMAGSGRPRERRDDVLFPAQGISGQIYGAVGIPSRSVSREPAARRLIESFARQLGGAQELHRTRRDLAEAEKLRRERHQELMARGEGVLRICPLCSRCYDQDVEACEDDSARLEKPPPFPFRVNGRYRLSRVIGEGGMGTVYQAHDERLGRDVAIKVIRSGQFHNANVRLRFEQEARAAARIDHPGVVAVFDSGELSDGSQFIVMELLRGRSLGAVLKRHGRGTPAQVARLLRQAAAALTSAHERGLLHRDIKPDNIFLVGDIDDFQAKILDFGVAKDLGQETNLTQTGTLVGTPLYMSPEQILCRPLDVRSDLYAFGAVVFFALVGRRVTMKETLIDVVLDVCHSDPPSVSSFLPDVPAEVDQAFARMLAREPGDRPGSALEWVSSFVDVLEQMPSSAAGWLDDPMDPAAESITCPEIAEEVEGDGIASWRVPGRTGTAADDGSGPDPHPRRASDVGEQS